MNRPAYRVHTPSYGKGARFIYFRTESRHQRMPVKRFSRAIALAVALFVASPAVAALAYDGAAAAKYADQYATSYNKAYPSFANKGGDCANFVSQALFAGGIQQRTTGSGTAVWYMGK